MIEQCPHIGHELYTYAAYDMLTQSLESHIQPLTDVLSESFKLHLCVEFYIDHSFTNAFTFISGMLSIKLKLQY